MVNQHPYIREVLNRRVCRCNAFPSVIRDSRMQAGMHIVLSTIEKMSISIKVVSGNHEAIRRGFRISLNQFLIDVLHRNQYYKTSSKN